MRIAESEDRLQTDSKRYLDAILPPDAIWYHTPNGGWRTKAQAGRLKAHGVLAGVPDWTIIHRGRVIYIELKTKRGALSAAQIAFRDRAQKAGAWHFVCRSLLEIDLALEAAGVETKGEVAA